MSIKAEDREAVESFAMALADLTVNSKPLINFLTMLAKGNIVCAGAIVDVIDNHLKKVPSVMKLPILYLIDSILKNVGEDYIFLLSCLICNTFVNIYKEVDEKSRLLMLKMRQTWDDIFPMKDLHYLDLELNAVDSDFSFTGGTFSVKRVAPLKVLINPKFLPSVNDSEVSGNNSTVEASSKAVSIDSSKAVKVLTVDDDTAEEMSLREELLLQKRKRELYREQSKVDLELLKVKTNLYSECKANREVESDVLLKDEVDKSASKNIAGNSEPNESQVDSTTDEMHSTVLYQGKDMTVRKNIHSSESLENTENLLSCNKYARCELLYFLTKLIDNRKPQILRDVIPSDKSCDSHNSNLLRHKTERSFMHSRIETPDNFSTHYKDHSYWAAKRRKRQIEEKGKYQHKIVSSLESSDAVNKNFIASNIKWHYVKTNCGCHPEVSPTDMPLRRHDICEHNRSKKDVSPCIPSALNPKHCEEAHLPNQVPGIHPTCSKLDRFSHRRNLEGEILKKTQAEGNICDKYPRLRNLAQSTRKKPLLPLPLAAPSCQGLDVNVWDCHCGNRGQDLRPSLHNSLKRPLLEERHRNIHEPKLMKPDSEENIVSLPPVSQLELDQINQDTMKTITVDNVARTIRFYGEIAVAIFSEDISREISFQPGEALVHINDVMIQCAFHESEKEVIVDGKIFRVHLGAPTRELYVNDEGFQCQFNYPRKEIILATGEILQVQLQSKSPPLVQVGAQRQDLVAGYVSMIIDNTDFLQIYLDAKPQRFDIDSVPHILKFEDALQTILVNGYPVSLQFGGPDITIIVNSKLHYVRLTELPCKITPGEIDIVSMCSNKTHFMLSHRECSAEILRNPPLASKMPLPLKNMSVEPEPKLFQPPHVFHLADVTHRLVRGKGKNSSDRKKKKYKKKKSRMSAKFSESVHHRLSNCNTRATPMSVPVELTGHPEVSLGVSEAAPTSGNIFSSLPTTNPSSETIFKPAVNIHSLFESLCKSGLLSCLSPTNSKSEELTQGADAGRSILEVNFNDSTTLKNKQPGIIEILYSGSQCSSCGIRFPPEHIETLRTHLDWHFQQNHQTKDSITSQGRTWYLKKMDWVNLCVSEPAGNSNVIGSKSDFLEDQELEVLPCIPSHNYPHGVHCELCHEKFEEFFNEEDDEWQLADCMESERHIYHPCCFKDLQVSNINDNGHQNEGVIESSHDASASHEQTLIAALESSNHFAINSCQREDDERKVGECTKDNSKFCPLPFHFLSNNNVQPMFMTADEKSVSCFSAAKLKITVADVKYDCVTKEEANEGENIQMCLSIPAPQDSMPLNLKPKLMGRKLTQLPPATKDFETSYLCVIV